MSRKCKYNAYTREITHKTLPIEAISLKIERVENGELENGELMKVFLKLMVPYQGKYKHF